MANSIKRNNNQYQADNDQSTDKSLLESILFLMTPEQREHFLKSSSSKGIIYVNRPPCFNYPLSVLLTKKVCNQLAELLKTENQTGLPQLQNDSDAQNHIEILKTDLEAGVRLFGARWYEDNDGKENVSIHVQSNSFVMKCILQIEADGKALFKAIHIEYSTDSNKSNTKTIDVDFELYETSEFKEPVDSDILDANKAVKNVGISTKSKLKDFFPHIKTAWYVYPPYSEDTIYFDYEAIEKIIWEIVNNRLLSGVYYWTRGHLKKLVDVISLSKLAMQYRYELHNETETPEGRCCKLKIHGHQEDIDRIKLAYVYTAENETDINDKNKYHNIRRLLKRRLRRPVVLERKGYKQTLHLFDIKGEGEIPSEGFLVDVGLESQIKKQIEAMHYLAAPKSVVHLTRLATLLGKVKISKFDLFSWESDHIELFDELLTKRQREAVFKALNTPDICLIQGPPGTGKTRIISEIVQQASRKGWKTLLVAPTHVAVDNVLESVGNKDNISPIRCANKDRLDSLPNHIQQFTYEQRKKSLVIHSQEKVKDDIASLNKEKMRLENASKVIRSLCSLRDNTIKLIAKERSLEKQFSSVKKNVQKEYTAELKKSKKIKRDRTALLYDSKEDLDDSIRALETLRVGIKQFKAGVYTNKDKTRFKLAQSNVDKIQGKVLKDIRGQFGKTEDTIHSIKIKIKTTEAKLKNTKNILCQLDDGMIPDTVWKTIQKALNVTAAKHNRNIDRKLEALEEARDRLGKNKKDNDGLRRLIEDIKTKQTMLAKGNIKPWWSKIFSLVWWQSKRIDFEERRSQYTMQLQDSLALMPGLELEIDKAQVLLKKSKTAKKEALAETEKTKLIKQHDLYRSRCSLQAKELNLLREQLRKENSNLAILGQKVKSARDRFEQASNQALKSAKKQIHQKLVSEVKKTRKEILLCKEKVRAAGNLALESQRNLERLQDKIAMAIKQNEEKLGSSIDALKRQITANADQFEHMKRQAALFLGENPPEQPSEIRVVLEKIAEQINRNEYLTSFSESWLDCLHRNSDDLSFRLAKYINLVCATTIGIASDEYFGDGKLLEQKQFDLLVIDEAGRVTEPQFLVAATRAKKWVIVGDHKQLPPYYDRKLNNIFLEVNELRKLDNLSQLDPAILRVSYFENLWNQLSSSKTEPEKAKARFVALDVQRRMHPNLAQFISDMFYPNEYNSPEEPEFAKEKTLDLPSFKYEITFIEVLPPKGVKRLESNLRFESEQKKLKLSCKTGYANLTEAKQAIEVLTSLLAEESVFAEQEALDSNNDPVATIGIISFYAG